MYSKYSSVRSNANAVVVRNAIESTCVNVGNWVAYGRINVQAALQNLSGPPTERTYQAQSITVLRGSATAGNVASLHAIDGDRYHLNSGIEFTYEIPGQPTRVTWSADYYAEFDVGPGVKVGGNIDITAWCTNPSVLRVLVYNFAAARWEYVVTSTPIDLTERTWNITFPSGPSSYISSTNKVRIRMLTSCPVPHNLRTDRLQLRMTGY